MCELLGMECNVPTDIVFSFRGLARRGGATGPHAHGWGVALYEGKSVRLFREPDACHDSALANYLKSHAIKTTVGIAHVRKKTRGRVRLDNTHPFTRELWGRTWTFAHNGTVARASWMNPTRFRPVGATDSELAFCTMLDHIAARHTDYPRARDEARALAQAIVAIGDRIGEEGTFNYLLSDGVSLYARCATKLHYIVRAHPFRRATLADDDFTIDFSQVTTPRDRVAVIATEPLTRDETWVKGEPGTTWLFRRGRLLATFGTARGAAPRLQSEATPSSARRVGRAPGRARRRTASR